MTLSDLAKYLSEIFNNLKHRAVSLRQLSFSFRRECNTFRRSYTTVSCYVSSKNLLLLLLLRVICMTLSTTAHHVRANQASMETFWELVDKGAL